MDEICAGQALALQWWLDRMELNPCQFAKKYGRKVSSIYDALSLKWAPGCGWWNQTAKGFGMALWEFDRDALLILRGEIPVPRNSQSPSKRSKSSP